MDRLLPEANADSWDKPVVPMPQVERQLLSEADVQRLFARRGVTTEAGPTADRQASCGHQGIAALRDATKRSKVRCVSVEQKIGKLFTSSA